MIWVQWYSGLLKHDDDLQSEKTYTRLGTTILWSGRKGGTLTFLPLGQHTRHELLRVVQNPPKDRRTQDAELKIHVLKLGPPNLATLPAALLSKQTVAVPFRTWRRLLIHEQCAVPLRSADMIAPNRVGTRPIVHQILQWRAVKLDKYEMPAPIQDVLESGLRILRTAQTMCEDQLISLVHSINIMRKVPDRFMVGITTNWDGVHWLTPPFSDKWTLDTGVIHVALHIPKCAFCPLASQDQESRIVCAQRTCALPPLYSYTHVLAVRYNKHTISIQRLCEILNRFNQQRERIINALVGDAGDDGTQDG